MSQYKAYIICTTPRSGSTLLCRLLSATAVAGKPESYFHLPSVASWTERLNLPLQQIEDDEDLLRAALTAIHKLGTGSTNTFGLRLMRMSFGFLMQKLDSLYPGLPSDRARFEAVFGRTLFIHLTRGDKVAQAVSRTKAEQTGLWHMAADGSELERLAPPQPPRYDPDQITHHIKELTEYDAAWTEWFDQEDIDPVRIKYEELSAFPSAAVAGILDRLGLDSAPAKGLVPEVAKLADETSRFWVERYKAEELAGSCFDRI